MCMVWTGPLSTRRSDTCPNILSLIDLILSIPAHSADAERGFSEMKLVKSDWRSNLRSDVCQIFSSSSFMQQTSRTLILNLPLPCGVCLEKLPNGLI